MKNFFTSLILFHLLVGFFGCVDLSRENQRFVDVITQIKSKYAPDRRTAIFDVTFKRMNKGIIVLGVVDNVDSKRAVIEGLSPLVKKIVDSLTVLPDAKLGNRTWGIVRLSAANMRRDPEQSAELVTQAIMGGIVKVLRESQGWYYVQTSDRYLGWMEDASFVLCTREEADVWIAARKVIVLPVYAAVRQEANTGSYPVSDLVTGSLLRNIGSTGAWTKVELPDGRTGFVPNSGVIDHETWRKNTTPTAEGVERMARALLGIPYLWGGTSTKAMDCSGFIKMVYLMNGMQLNRDANQQADQGVDILPGEKFENLRRGDLLFFGRKENNQNPENITHEAMYLKDLTYIHCSHFAGMVKINSLDPASPVFNPHILRSFVRARRVIPTSPTMTEAPSHR
jgi:cell wall-associated NlpC family hydrolase